jgi:hypothetical protein
VTLETGAEEAGAEEAGVLLAAVLVVPGLQPKRTRRANAAILTELFFISDMKILSITYLITII